MQTRKRRFFVILLHLVGVQHPSWLSHLNNNNHTGIVAVLPWPVSLETIQLGDLALESSSISKQSQQRKKSEKENPPVWLQDTRDGTCLGPNGSFSECGDATLWFVGQTQIHKHRLLLSGSYQLRKEAPSGYTFQVADRDVEHQPRSLKETECLDSTFRKNGHSRPHVSSIQVTKCRKRIWQPLTNVWNVNEHGNLQDTNHRCLARRNNDAVLVDCSTASTVSFSFLRYRAVPVPEPNDRASPKTKPSEKPLYTIDADTVVRVDSLPQFRDRAHDSSSVSNKPSELKIQRNPLLFPQKEKTPTRSPLHVILDNTNPILVANNGVRSTLPTSTATMTDLKSTMPNNVRRIQTHPYINTAQNEIWTDPQTNLEYQTDLHRYLEWDRQQHGRHTLTGVGQYRKGFVIKVYGVAFYVSKRDVLADSTLKMYATYTAEQLRTMPEFYQHLYTMGTAEAGGHFDRTILLKTNMQLSAETMRSSLKADWSYLTDEAKGLLTDCSMKPRPANAHMLETIASPDNPSRCSCSQIAPPEYNADPECCARGTELVFTWTKDNNLEVRLDGVRIESFARPDIAEGIFYEYLRYDDPISPEFRERVVDGFPFLLAPLAQVRGVKIGSSHPKPHARPNAVLTAVGGFMESMRHQAGEAAGSARRNAMGMVDNAGHAARAFGDAAMEMGKEIDRRRELLVKHSAAAPGTVMKLMARDEETIRALQNWVTGKAPEPEVEEVHEEPILELLSSPLSRWFGDDHYYAPDEIGPMKIHPTINKIILALVHLYLLLLFIASFPGSYSIRTKFVIGRKSLREISDSDSDSSEDKDRGFRDRQQQRPCARNFISQAQKVLRTKDSTEPPLKKQSLSYFF